MPSGESNTLSPLTAAMVMARLRENFRQLPDGRKGGNNQRYTLEDAALSAFAVFFTQSPSFLDYQRRLQHTHGSNNAMTLFGAHRIPSDPQIRNLLDPVAAEQVSPLLMELVEDLYQRNALASHRTLAGGFTVALDGTNYFASTAIHCPHCSTRTLANGETQYYHTVVTPGDRRRGSENGLSPATGLRRPPRWSCQAGL